MRLFNYENKLEISAKSFENDRLMKKI